MISTSLSSASRQWVKSDCQHSLGAAASNRTHELRGRLRGSATMRSAAWRTRRMDVEGTARPLASEVPGDRHRAGIETAGGELGAHGHDARPDGVGRPARVGQRSSRARLEGLEPAVTVATQERVQVASTDPMLGRHGRDGRLR
jgi:hypothetical protein